MSCVTDVILILGCGEYDREDEEGRDVDSEGIVAVNAWLLESSRSSLREIDYARAGGHKRHQCKIYTAAVNYLDTDGFLAVVAGQPWEYPDAVQVLIQEEDDERFAMYCLGREWIRKVKVISEHLAEHDKRRGEDRP